MTYRSPNADAYDVKRAHERDQAPMTLDRTIQGTIDEAPTPKVRPYTPVEAAAHLGRVFIYADQNRVLKAVDAKEILPFNHRPKMSYACFANHCTWADDGSPCGFLEANG